MADYRTYLCYGNRDLFQIEGGSYLFEEGRCKVVNELDTFDYTPSFDTFKL